jgi:hypothetical protein
MSKTKQERIDRYRKQQRHLREGELQNLGGWKYLQGQALGT